MYKIFLIENGGCLIHAYTKVYKIFGQNGGGCFITPIALIEKKN